MYGHGKNLNAIQGQKMENRSLDVHRAKPAELKNGVEEKVGISDLENTMLSVCTS